MDMSNATAAGPSYGILDVIMGNVPKEGKAEGKEFEPMLNLIKALEDKKNEDSTADGRTDKETTLGTNAVDYRFVNSPGINAVMSASDNQALLKWAEDQGVPRERAEATLLLATMKAQGSMQGQGMQMVQPEQQEAWTKYLAANSSAPILRTEKSVSEADAYQQLTAEGLLETRNGKNQSGLDPKYVVPEGVFVKESLMDKHKMDVAMLQRPAEKIMSTQDYLQIQQQISSSSQQAPIKEANSKASMPNGESDTASVKQDAVAEPAAGAVGAGIATLSSKSSKHSAEDGAMGENKSSDKEKPNLKTEKASADRMEIPTDLPAGVNAETGIKVAGGLMAKDIFLTGMKPNELRTGLMDEVAQSVRTQAVKGGGEMKLIIHPDNLGELKLKVSTRDSKVEVSVMADNDQVAGILRKSVDELRSALSEQNLALAKFDVKIADNTTNAMLNSQGGNMDNFFSAQHQAAQDFQQGMSNGQDGGRFAQGQEFSGGRSYMADDVKPASRQKTAAPRIKSETNRLDVVA